MPRNRGYQTEELKKEKAIKWHQWRYYFIYYFIFLFQFLKHLNILWIVQRLRFYHSNIILHNDQLC